MDNSASAAPATPVAAPALVTLVAPDTNTVDGLRQITAQEYIKRGEQTGRFLEKQAQQELMRSIVAACPGKPEIAITAFLTGQSADSVKLAFEAAQSAEQAANTRIAAMELEHERKLALSVAGGYPGGVAMGVDNKDDGEILFAPDTPPDVQAKMEWDSNHKNCRHTGATEAQYLAMRKRQIAGVVRTFTPAK
jgi:hypothetical protein